MSRLSVAGADPDTFSPLTCSPLTLAYSDIVTAALPLRDRGVAGSLVLLTRTLGTVTAASVVLMVFGILNMKYGFLEGFQKAFQLAALPAFGAAASAFFTAPAPRSNS